MQTTRRPVPSLAALKALRQLAYVASGTACGAAALLYEERRRRIHFLRKVAENGRVLKDVARQSRRGHASVALAAHGSAHDMAPLDLDQPWADERQLYHEDRLQEQGRLRTRSRTTSGRDTTNARLLRRRSEELPSQVERAYEIWQSSHGRTESADATRSTAGMSNPAKQASTSAIRLEHKTHASKTPPQASTHARSLDTRAKQDWARAWFAGSEDRATTAEREVILGKVRKTIAKWSSAVARSQNGRHDLGQQWAELGRWAESLDQDHAFIVAAANGEAHMSHVIPAAVSLRLPQLVQAVCNHCVAEGDMRAAATEVTDALLASENPAAFTEIRAMTQDRVRSTIRRSAFRGPRALELKWLQFQLQVLQDLERAVSLSDGRPENPQTTLEELLSTLLATTEGDEIVTRLFGLVDRLITSDKSGAAIQLLVKCTAAISGTSNQAAALWEHALQSLLQRQDRVTAIEALSLMRARNLASDNLVFDVWNSCSTDVELLEMYTSLQLNPMPAQMVISRILTAILNTGSAEMIKSEMNGQLGRMWTTTLVRNWEATDNLDLLTSQFWTLQKAIGKGHLAPVLYDVAIRKCSSGGRSEAAELIKAHRQSISANGMASGSISKLLQLAKQDDWEAVSKQLHHLTPRHFGTMQTQARAQMLDALFKAFLSTKRSADDLFEFGVLVLSKVHDYITPTQALRLLSMTLVRLGHIDVLTMLHEYADTHLETPLELSAVDSADLFRSFYYSFRPSHADLAMLIDRCYTQAWQSVSKHHLALLLVSASYEAKKSQQRRLGSDTRVMIQQSLMDIKKPELQRSLLLEDGLMDRYFGERKLNIEVDRAGPDGQEDLLLSLFGADAEHDALSVDALEDSDIFSDYDESGTSARHSDLGSALVGDSHVAVTDGTVASGSDKEQIWSSSTTGDTPLEARSSRSTNHVGCADVHFEHAMTKALLHGAQLEGGQQDIGSLIDKLTPMNALAPGATLASLAAPAKHKDSATLRQILRKAGGDDSLIQSRQALARLSDMAASRDQVSFMDTVTELSDLVTEEYQRLESCGQLPDHSLVVTLAWIMLKNKQPTLAMQLLRHALESHWSAVRPPDCAFMSMLLKSYIALGRSDGVRWVHDYLMKEGVRIEKRLLTTIRTACEELPVRRSNKQLLTALENMHETCKSLRDKQIAQARAVGSQMVAYIGKTASRAATVTWQAPDDFRAQGADVESKGQQQFREAVYVHSVCADVVTMAKQSHAPVRKEYKNNMDLRMVRAMRRVERSRVLRKEVESLA